MQWLHDEPEELARLAHFLHQCGTVFPGLRVGRERIILLIPDPIHRGSMHKGGTSFAASGGRDRELAHLKLSRSYMSRGSSTTYCEEVCPAWK